MDDLFTALSRCLFYPPFGSLSPLVASESNTPLWSPLVQGGTLGGSLRPMWRERPRWVDISTWFKET